MEIGKKSLIFILLLLCVTGYLHINKQTVLRVILIVIDVKNTDNFQRKTLESKSKSQLHKISLLDTVLPIIDSLLYGR